MEIFNHVNQPLGKIQDYVLSIFDFSVRYIVVSVEAELRIKDVLFIIPWNAITLDEEKNIFIIPLDAEELRRAPSCSAEWPNSPDTFLLTKVDQFYEHTLAAS